MAMSKGSRARLLGGIKETVYGADPAIPTAVVLPINSSSIKAAQTLTSPKTLRGRRDPAKPFQGNVNVSGDVVVPIDTIAFGYWLQMLLGDPVTTSAGGGYYKHVYKIPDSMSSFVLEHQYLDTTLFDKFNGCKISALKLSVGGDGELLATISVLGAKETTGTSSVDDHPILLPLTRFGQFQAVIQEAGVTVATISELGLTLSAGLDETVFVIGGGGIRGSLPEGIMTLSGTIKMMFENWTMYDKAVNGTESSIRLTFTNGSNVLDFLFNEVMFARNAPGIPGPGGIFIDTTFEGYWDDHVTSSGVVVSLTNVKSTYATIAGSTTTSSTTTSSTTTTAP